MTVATAEKIPRLRAVGLNFTPPSSTIGRVDPTSKYAASRLQLLDRGYHYPPSGLRRILLLRTLVNRGGYLTRGGVGAVPALSQNTCAAISKAMAITAMTMSGIIGRSKLERFPEASSTRITPRMPRKLWKAIVP